MTKEQLQKALDEKGCKVRIVDFEFCPQCDNNYWVAYTDLSGENYKDILAIDLDEAVEFISNPVTI